ncbi:MAG: spore germination protein [Firmicutes bacterium]|nr:spore germination protein [Bacillota bacterium]
MNPFPRISQWQLLTLCFIAAFGDSMATLPRSVGEIAKEDMWLSVIFGGVLFLFTVWTAITLASYYPNSTCIEYHQILLGPLLGQILNAVMIVLLLLVPILSIRSFVVALKIYLLDVTPTFVIVLSLLTFITYSAQYGLLPVIRVLQFTFMSIHSFFFIVVLLGLFSIKASHFQPFLAQGIMPVLKGAIPSWYSYTGPEFVVCLLYPFFIQKNKVLTYGFVSVLVLTAVYTLITGIVQGILGVAETTRMLVPTIIAYRGVEIPDTFIERLDGYFFSMWIPVLMVCMLLWVYLAVFGIKQMARLEYSRPVVILVCSLILYFVVAIPNLQTASTISEWANYALLAWGMGVLPLLLALAWWKHRR